MADFEKLFTAFVGTGPLDFDWEYFDKEDLRVDVGGTILKIEEFDHAPNVVGEAWMGGVITLKAGVAGVDVKIWRDTTHLSSAKDGVTEPGLNREVDRLNARAEDLKRLISNPPSAGNNLAELGRDLHAVGMLGRSMDLRSLDGGADKVRSGYICNYRQTPGDTPRAGQGLWIWYAESLRRDDGGFGTIKPVTIADAAPGRWHGPAGEEELSVMIGQSIVYATANEFVIKQNGEPHFTTTPCHENQIIEDQGDGTYKQTFVGKDPGPAILCYRPDQDDVGPVTVGLEPFKNGLNSVHLGQAQARHNATGRRITLITVAEGSQAIDLYDAENEAEITSITPGNPLIIAVSDCRKLAAATTTNKASKVTLLGLTGVPTSPTGWYYAMNTSWVYGDIRKATAPVPGTFEVHTIDGPVNGAGVTAAAGSKVGIHHLLDELIRQVERTMELTGLRKIRIWSDIQNGGNVGLSYDDLVSTVGGVSQPEDYQSMREKIYAALMNRTSVFDGVEGHWCDSDSMWVSYESLRTNAGQKSYEKARNDIVSLQADLGPRHAVASSAGYTAVDGSHPENRHNWGEEVGGAALRSFEGGRFQAAALHQIRRLLRPDASLGSRMHGKDINNTIYDLRAQPNNGRLVLNGQLFTPSASLFVIPDDMGTDGDDIGGEFCLYVTSNSGATPTFTGGAYPDGRTRVIYIPPPEEPTFVTTFVDEVSGVETINEYICEHKGIDYSFKYRGKRKWLVGHAPRT